MDFVLNGSPRKWEGDPELSLLKYLRDVEGLTSMKDGCSGQGGCGACTIVIDDRAMLSCVMPMKKVEGHAVITTEGLPKRVQQAFAGGFVIKGGVQCGFCTPGVVMRAWALLLKHPNPTHEQVRESLNHNICRCTGYQKIEDSIMMAAQAIREKKPIELPSDTGAVGSRHPKYDSFERVLGHVPYVADLNFDGMIHGALRFSEHPRAKILSIDTREALKVPGVIRIFTASDIPGERYIGVIYNDWPLMIPVGGETKYVGDVLCGVVATTEEAARKGAATIKVTYQVLEPVVDPHKAMERNSPQVGKNGNILSTSLIQRGNFEDALQKTVHIASGVFNTQRIEHAFLEPECCIAKPSDTSDEPGLEVYSQTQGAYEDRRQIAKLLALPETKIRVIQVPNGGGFGGKEDLTVQGHASLYSWILKKPVKVALTRDESMRMHPKRHPFELDYTLGCDVEGNLTFLKAKILADSGAYASVGMKVLERAVAHATGAYTVPVVDVRGSAVYTNNIPGGAMRGFGVNQATFAMESCIDELCEKGNFDRWDFRWRNALHVGTPNTAGQLMNSGVGVRACLEALKDKYQSLKCVGLAAGIKNTGVGCGMADIGRAKIVVKSAKHIVIHHGWTEMGQGVHTVAIQTFVQETGLPAKLCDVVVDTSGDVHCGMTTASRGTSLVGNAVIEACKPFKADLEKKGGDLKKLIGKEYRGEWICDWTTKLGEEVPDKEICSHYSYGYAAQLVELDEHGKIVKIYAAHDAGKIINPTLFEGQIEGAVHMGLGYALTEDFPMEGGKPVTTKIGRLGIIKAKDMPPVEVIGVEVHDPHGPFGAKGVGEIGLVPTAAAVANALYQFDKIRRYKLPMKVACLKNKA